MNIELGHAGPQGAAIETEDFRRAVFPAYFPPGLLQHLEDIVPFHRGQAFAHWSQLPGRPVEFVHQAQFGTR